MSNPFTVSLTDSLITLTVLCAAFAACLHSVIQLAAM